MFTGIIETIGTVVAAPSGAGPGCLTIEAGPLVDGLIVGASVSVNGVCLTVSGIDGGRLAFDVIAETLGRSNLRQVRPGHRVNLERSLRPDGRLDGHIVQGHVDGTAVIRARRESAREQVVELEPEPSILPLIVPKGSVALDGISLTVAELHDGRFSVALIPTTIRGTTLWERPVGAIINVETDILVRTVVHWLEQMHGRSASPGLTPQRLEELGFA